MKVYLITDAEKQALLQELELTKFLAPNDQFLREGMKPQEVAEAIHRRFHFVVSKHLSEYSK